MAQQKFQSGTHSQCESGYEIHTSSTDYKVDTIHLVWAGELVASCSCKEMIKAIEHANDFNARCKAENELKQIKE